MADLPQSALRVEPLNSSHDRACFCCGIAALDDYLHKRAKQDARNRVAAPFILSYGDEPTIVGYYTLSALSILLTDLPPSTAKKLPRYPNVPVTLLGRLALDARFHGRGLGEHLLMDALFRAHIHANEIASFAVVVDAINANASDFYQRYDFQPFPQRPNRLFLPMKTIAQIFNT